MTPLHDYPTPLTDAVAAHKDDMGQPWAKTLLRMLDHARDLERKLALCRDVLKLALSFSEDEQDREIFRKALDATK